MKRLAFSALLLLGCARSSSGCSDGLLSDPLAALPDLSSPADVGNDPLPPDLACPSGQLMCSNGCHECCESGDCGYNLCRLSDQVCIGPDGGLPPTTSCQPPLKVCAAGSDPPCGRCCDHGDCGPGGACIKGSCYLDLCNNAMLDDSGASHESDVDCGGSCVRCANGRLCNRNEDCASSLCTSGRCADSGHYPSVCPPDTRHCGSGFCAQCCLGSDCSSGVCSKTGQCLPWYCADGVVDAYETDIDCGGNTVCDRCLLDANCRAGSDCASQRCDPGKGKCVPP